MIEHGVDGFLSNDIDEIVDILLDLDSDIELRKKIGNIKENKRIN